MFPFTTLESERNSVTKARISPIDRIIQANVSLASSFIENDICTIAEKLHKEYGFTIVMVTHNANIAEMADTVIRMNSGEIAERYTNAVQKTAYEIGW